MVLVWVGVVIALAAALALLPYDRMPGWVTLYIGVGVVCTLIVVGVAVLA